MNKTRDVISAYEAWDPEEESSTELAERHGISKARLYQILEAAGITPKARRPKGGGFEESQLSAWDSGEDGGTKSFDYLKAEGALRILEEEFEKMRVELARYHERYGPLNS